MKKKPEKETYPKNRDGMWKFMRKHKSFTIDDVNDVVRMHRTSVREYVHMLLKGGYIVREKPATYGFTEGDVFRLVRDVGHHRPELEEDGTATPPSGIQKMWMAMKALKVFNYKDVSLSAAVTHTAARSYCIALRKAEYLVVHKASVPGTPEQYIFNRKMDSGLYAPQVKRMKVVFDRNLNKVVWTPESEAA